MADFDIGNHHALVLQSNRFHPSCSNVLLAARLKHARFGQTGPRAHLGRCVCTNWARECNFGLKSPVADCACLSGGAA